MFLLLLLLFRLRSCAAAPAEEEEEVEEEDEAAATTDEIDDAGLGAEAFSSTSQLLRLSLRRLRLPLESQQAAGGAAAESACPRASGRRESIGPRSLS